MPSVRDSLALCACNGAPVRTFDSPVFGTAHCCFDPTIQTTEATRDQLDTFGLDRRSSRRGSEIIKGCQTLGAGFSRVYVAEGVV